jgi:hypothetical protein
VALNRPNHNTDCRDHHIVAGLDPAMAAGRLFRGRAGADRVPLLALLRCTPLTEDQIKEVVRNITAQDHEGSIDDDEIEVFIKDVTHHDAGPENVRRVAARLPAAGWPLAGVDHAATR